MSLEMKKIVLTFFFILMLLVGFFIGTYQKDNNQIDDYKTIHSRILNKYLGNAPAWVDARKKAIINDNINILQWERNMIYLIHTYDLKSNYLEENLNKESLTLLPSVVLDLNDLSLPPILQQNQDRNWFIAAYPDVVDYFFPQYNYRNIPEVNEEHKGNLLRKEMDRVQKRIESTKNDFDNMVKIISKKNVSQTSTLIMIKDFYKEKINKKFILAKKSRQVEYLKDINCKPESYEDADYFIINFLAASSSDKAKKVIKHIYKQNLPIHKDNEFHVVTIGVLALHEPINEIDIGKSLLEKVIDYNKLSFSANNGMFLFAYKENNLSNMLKFAENLIESDYMSYLNQVKESSTDMSYLHETAITYDLVSEIFRKTGKTNLSHKASNISKRIISLSK